MRDAEERGAHKVCRVVNEVLRWLLSELPSMCIVVWGLITRHVQYVLSIELCLNRED